MTWAAEHVVGVAKGVSEDILEDLQMGFHAAEQMGLDAAGAEMPEKMEERS